MLTQVCQYLRNWFDKAKYMGDFVISSGVLVYAGGGTLPLIDGQYFRIVGSVLNDGVYKYGDADLQDEEFSGSVWALAIPPTVISLTREIEEWTTANLNAINSPYQSESFGGYSYSLKSGGSAGGSISWQSQFADRLAPWRKI